MKKARKLFWFGLFFITAVLVSVVFVQANIQSSKNNYKTTETVYARSTSRLCINVPPGENVSLYVVEDKDEWFEGDFLEEVRDFPQQVPNSLFFSKKIWEDSKAGNYDIIIDCVENEKYDLLEPIDSFDEIGFTVVFEKGSSSAFIGEKDVGNHSWQYDSEEPDLINEMLQLSLLANGEDVELGNITIQASGNGDDTKINLLEIYADENNNGKLDEGEIMIGDSQPAYTTDNALTIISLDYVLTNNLNESILIVYEMEETISEGEFSLSVKALSGRGIESDEIIIFSGLPVSSGVKTVLPEKTCLGSLSLELNPNPALKNDSVIVKMNNLNNCTNKEISFSKNPCSFAVGEIDSCILGEGDNGCELNLTGLETKRYHACIDKNMDGDFLDFGESAFVDLVVIIEEIEEFNITEELNVTEETEGAEITGWNIQELKEKFPGMGSLFVLLEITLLLILFVLIIISFRLRRPRTVKVRAPEE